MFCICSVLNLDRCAGVSASNCTAVIRPKNFDGNSFVWLSVNVKRFPEFINAAPCAAVNAAKVSLLFASNWPIDIVAKAAAVRLRSCSTRILPSCWALSAKTWAAFNPITASSERAFKSSAWADAKKAGVNAATCLLVSAFTWFAVNLACNSDQFVNSLISVVDNCVTWPSVKQRNQFLSALLNAFKPIDSITLCDNILMSSASSE